MERRSFELGAQHLASAFDGELDAGGLARPEPGGGAGDVLAADARVELFGGHGLRRCRARRARRGSAVTASFSRAFIAVSRSARIDARAPRRWRARSRDPRAVGPHLGHGPLVVEQHRIAPRSPWRRRAGGGRGRAPWRGCGSGAHRIARLDELEGAARRDVLGQGRSGERVGAWRSTARPWLTETASSPSW